MFFGFGHQLLLGSIMTLALTLCSLVVGTLLGITLTAIRLSHSRLLSRLCDKLVAMIRGLPELLVLFAIYFGSESLLVKITGHYVEISPFIAGVIALGIIFAAYFSQTLYSAYLAIAPGTIEAAHAFAFSRWQRFYHITLARMWRYALPGFGNLCLTLLKDTSIVSLIGLNDLMRMAHIASGATSQPFIFYLAAALIYLCMTALLTFLLNWMNRHLELST